MKLFLCCTVHHSDEPSKRGLPVWSDWRVESMSTFFGKIVSIGQVKQTLRRTYPCARCRDVCILASPVLSLPLSRFELIFPAKKWWTKGQIKSRKNEFNDSHHSPASRYLPFCTAGTTSNEILFVRFHRRKVCPIPPHDVRSSVEREVLDPARMPFLMSYAR